MSTAERRSDQPPDDETDFWGDLDRAWEALAGPSVTRFPAEDDLLPPDEPGSWWEGTPLEEAVRLAEKMQAARWLRERCETDMELARQADARGDERAERRYLNRALRMIQRAHELQDEVEQALAGPRDGDQATGE